MQLPKKKNWRMSRWSIRPSWSLANAPQGSSTSTGPVDSPPVALRWSMVMTWKSFLNSSGMLITAFGQMSGSFSSLPDFDTGATHDRRHESPQHGHSQALGLPMSPKADPAAVLGRAP